VSVDNVQRQRPARMQLTFALLVLELCRRAGGNAQQSERTGDTLAALEALTAGDRSLQSRPLREVLAAAQDVYRLLEAEGRVLDSLLPRTIIHLDAVLAAVAEGTMPRHDMRPALRRAFMQPAS
jgi:hypothetical protein